MDEPQEFHIPITTPSLAVAVLASHSGYSKQVIKTFMQQGAVWLSRGKHTRRLRRAKAALHSGDQLHAYINPDVLAASVPAAQLIADEGAYSIWHKPYGMLSQGSKWGDHCTISRWAETQLQPERPAFIVHRLDRATSGLIIIAHSKTMAQQLSSLFAQRKIEKKYQAIVAGDFSAQPQPLTVNLALNGKAACSHFYHLAYDSEKNHSLLDVKIESGRKHQIRQHLASVGFPIVRDRLYGQLPEGQSHSNDLQLCAYYLAFNCPVSGEAKHYRLSDEVLLSL